ncbi:MAG: oligosaccharide flippase family protein [Weeksellaceae bacterium]|nr:oligosaccharide flippase family protein [Bacteroidota bacterium]MCG2781606.1 oligosaccharide flippase family protein [Weeksellaceae bacterium]
MKDSSQNTVQAFWVLLGSISAFAFAIVSSMILSRYFSKEDYGTYKQVMYIYNTLLVVFTLGLPRAYTYFLPQARDEAAKDIIDKISILLLFLGCTMSAVVFAGADLFAQLLKNDSLGTPLKYFSLVPLFMLPTMGLEGILATYKKTIFLAFYTTITKIFMLICVTVPVVFFDGGVEEALVGFTISSFICFLSALYLKKLPLKNIKKIKSDITYKEIFAYTLPLMGAGVWGIIIASSDQFFISRYFGKEVFADFANGSLELPFVSMVIASAATVLSPVFVRMIKSNYEEGKQEIFDLWNSVLIKTVKIIYPLVIFCFCFADIIMILLYGESYQNSGIYFQIKLVVNFFTVISFAPLMLAIGGEKFYYQAHMWGAVVLVILQFVSVHIFSTPYMVVVISVLCQIARILVMLQYIAKFFNIRMFHLFPIKLIAVIIVPSLIFLFLLKFVLVSQLHLAHFVVLTIALLLFIIFLIILIKIKKLDYQSVVQPLLNKLR